MADGVDSGGSAQADKWAHARVGLVLGAGGLVGQAYEAGVLAALQADLAWDARSADLIVGTSAGSLSGAMLRMGIPVSDAAKWTAGDQLRLPSELEALDALLRKLPEVDWKNLLGRWRVPPIWRFLSADGTSRSNVLLPLLGSAIPNGKTSLIEILNEDPGSWSFDPWPEGLMICATRRRDGERVVFGTSDSPPATVPTAVAASCAIPGHFASVVIDDTEYLDGGLYSPTNADLLIGQEIDLAIIISPMSGGSGPIDGTVRSFARHRLHAEINRLKSSGCEALVFEPSHNVVRAMGLNPMARNHLARTTQAARIDATRFTRSSHVSSLFGRRTVTSAQTLVA